MKRVVGSGGAGRRAQQIDHPAGDRRRRVDECHRPGRQPLQPVQQQAGSGCRPARSCRCARLPARRSTARSRPRCRRRPPARRATPPRRVRRAAASRPGDRAAVGEVADQGAGVFALNRRFGAEHRHELGLRGCAGRLDRRHGADERHFEVRPQLRQHQRRGGVAGDHHEVGPVRRDQLAHHRRARARPARLRPAAVGEEGVVGGIDEARVRPRLRTSRWTVSPPSPESNTRMVGVMAGVDRKVRLRESP